MSKTKKAGRNKRQRDGCGEGAVGAAAPKQVAKERAAADAKATSSSDAMHVLDTDPVQFLVAPEPREEFLSEVWEKGPRVFRATPGRRAFLKGLFGIQALKRHAEEVEGTEDGLEFGLDVVAARYVDGVRETLSPGGLGGGAGGGGSSDDEEGGEGEEEGEDGAGEQGEEFGASWEALRHLFEEEGCTLQVHQPQRFVDGIWRMVSSLESQLGCLVGCNAYLTPGGGKQGLAPHHDDVEVFVCQTQGSKTWRLYAPLHGFELPSKPSGDLSEDDIGKPVQEVTLEVGDVLYMPRGTIHCATSSESGPSCHLTLSSYQRWTWGDLATSVLEQALAGTGAGWGPHAPLQLRRGLSPGFLYDVGLQADAERAAQRAAGNGIASLDARPSKMQKQQQQQEQHLAHAAALAGGLRALADLVEKDPSLVSAAADAMSADFMRSRVPPHPEQLLPQGGPPAAADVRVRPSAPRRSRLVPCPDAPAHMGACVRLLSCQNNPRDSHMMPGAGGFPGFPGPGSSDDDDGDDGDGAEVMEFGSGSDDDDDGDDAAPELVPISKPAAGKGKKAKGGEGKKAKGGEGEDGGEGSEDEEGGDGEQKEEDDDEEEEGAACCDVAKTEGRPPCCSGDKALPDEPGGDLVFPADYLPALVTLLTCPAAAGALNPKTLDPKLCPTAADGDGSGGCGKGGAKDGAKAKGKCCSGKAGAKGGGGDVGGAIGGSGGEGVAVGDIPLPEGAYPRGKDEARQQLAVSLWAEGLLASSSSS